MEIARHTEQWRRDGGRYIPHPATWLRREGWEDQHEPEIAPLRRGGRESERIGDAITNLRDLFGGSHGGADIPASDDLPGGRLLGGREHGEGRCVLGPARGPARRPLPGTAVRVAVGNDSRFPTVARLRELYRDEGVRRQATPRALTAARSSTNAGAANRIAELRQAIRRAGAAAVSEVRRHVEKASCAARSAETRRAALESGALAPEAESANGGRAPDEATEGIHDQRGDLPPAAAPARGAPRRATARAAGWDLRAAESVTVDPQSWAVSPHRLQLHARGPRSEWGWSAHGPGRRPTTA
ncbi:MAG: hypothetical protein U5L11_01065 [Arhodomonas sp.]|nr:hypothetical protein [Arhodomonas sp.]